MSAPAMTAKQCTNTGNEHRDNSADNHGCAESIMPAAHRSHQEHRAADHERRESNGTAEPLEIAAKATPQGLQSRSLHPAQIAFGNMSEDAARVAGRISDQTLHFARQRSGLVLD